MAVMGDLHPSSGVTPMKTKVDYATYKSPYGPKYVLARRNDEGADGLADIR